MLCETRRGSVSEAQKGVKTLRIQLFPLMRALGVIVDILL